jgi:hypothetical protein
VPPTRIAGTLWIGFGRPVVKCAARETFRIKCAEPAPGASPWGSISPGYLLRRTASTDQEPLRTRSPTRATYGSWPGRLIPSQESHRASLTAAAGLRPFG